MRGVLPRVTLTMGGIVLLLAVWSANAPAADVAPQAQSATPDHVRQALNARVDALAGKPNLLVLVVRVEGEIDIKQAAYVGRAVRYAGSVKPDLVLLELNTPGGLVNYMEEIGKQIRSLDPISTVCFVDDEAFSAGVYLAISCDRIYMRPGATIGATTPWVPGPGGLPAELPEDVKKKEYSALKAMFRAVAQQKGYPGALIEGMIDPSVVVQQVEIDGTKTILTKEEVENRRQAMERELKGSAAERREESDRRVVVLSTIQEGKGPIALTGTEAKQYGLADGVVGSRSELLSQLRIEHPRIEQVQHSWSETVFGWLAGPIISGILLTVGLMALYVEFKTPGFGVPGITGIVCIALVLFSQYFVGLADYTDILIFVIGVILLATELFVLPGHGILGIMGLILMVVALFLSRQPFVIPDPGNPWDVDLFQVNFIVMGASLVALFIFAVALARYLPGMPLLGRLVLRAAGPGTPEELVGSAGTAKHDVEVGAVGVSLSELRPSGRAQFGSKIFDVMTRGEFLGPGERIEALETGGNRIVVRAAKSGGTEKST